MCLDCDFERENVDLKFVFVISLFVFVFVIVIVIVFQSVFVFGSEIFFFLVGPRIGPNPLTGPVGLGKKTRLVNGPSPSHGSWPAGRVLV